MHALSVSPGHEERYSLQEHGFTVVRGLLGPHAIERAKLGFDRLLAIARTLPASQEVHGTSFVVTPDPFRLHRAVWCGGAAPELRLGGDRRFLDVACAALGANHVVQLIQQAHYKLPGDGVAFDWHQDASNRRFSTDQWQDSDGSGTFIQIAVAIDPMDASNGGLQFIPRSHHGGFIADPLTGVLDPTRYHPERAVTPVLEAGDAIVFGAFTVHGSAPNHSDSPRRLFLQGYTLPGVNRRVYPGAGTGVWRSKS